MASTKRRRLLGRALATTKCQLSSICSTPALWTVLIIFSSARRECSIHGGAWPLAYELHACLVRAFQAYYLANASTPQSTCYCLIYPSNLYDMSHQEGQSAALGREQWCTSLQRCYTDQMCDSCKPALSDWLDKHQHIDESTSTKVILLDSQQGSIYSFQAAFLVFLVSQTMPLQ